MPTLTVDQLKTQYHDTQWRRKFVDYCDLIELLEDCIIPDTYGISDALNNALHLTPAGASIRDRLVTREGVKAKEANLMCALAIGHVDLFVDIERIDIDELQEAIAGEFEHKRIRFPFVFGREFYDAYAGQFDDGHDSLTNEQTIRLLESLPPGVFQYGAFTTGPYGLRRSKAARGIRASRTVPAYHCSRPMCNLLHPVQLETSHVAPINRDREKIEQALRRIADQPSEWWQFAAELKGLKAARFSDQKAGVLLPLLGDALSVDELRVLVVELLDNTAGELRADVAEFLKVKSAKAATANLDRAALLQITLFTTEEVITAAIDRLVRNGDILVPAGEVRRPVVNRSISSGAFRLRPELSHLGVRFVSDEAGFGLLREHRLLENLYAREAETDIAELDWQLRGIDIEDLGERLEFFYRQNSPREALRRMVLARKTNMVTACQEVGIDDADGISDEEVIDSLLWKLGFSVPSGDDPHATFWRRFELLWALTQSTNVGGSERFLEAASPFFTALEGLLLDSLAFTSWALLFDHPAADSPFSYDDQTDRRRGLEFLAGFTGSQDRSVDFVAERVDLSHLIGAFSALARHLEEQVANSEQHVRPKADLPEYAEVTDLKEFAFRSVVPFLNLTAPSRQRIVEGLRGLTDILSSGEVAQVRNDYSHYRRNGPDVSRVESALEACRQAVSKIETLGLCRLLFAPSSVGRDEWGRARHEFRGPRSYEHVFMRPTRYDWMGLPPLSAQVYLLRSACIGEPTEVLRFTRRYESAFSDMWTRFPARRRQRSLEETQSESHLGTVDSRAHLST